MEDMSTKIICECGQKNIAQAIEIFKSTTLPYKKAKKLVTECNQTCCRRPLMALFNMIEFGEIDIEEIAFLIEQKNSRYEECEDE
ncbi:MAG: hypothetical protein KA253_04775 [Campylobacteraceae bacterium]|jgi:hypothetical protein|nr:hypothetical protein [Campylobacteraceae bacterium]